MSDTTEQTVCEHLEKHLFDRIWNEPYKEYRTNVAPRLLTPKAVTGTYTPRYKQISLPTTSDMYFVYSIALEEITPFQLNIEKWVKLSDYCKSNLLDLQMYTETGVWLWRDGIYIRAGVVNNAILIAVRRDMFKKCCGTTYDPARVYFTKYHDSDMEQSIKYSYARVSNKGQLTEAFGKIAGADMVFVNGKYADVKYPTDLSVGDFVEGIFDDNILTVITIDMQNKATITYTSDRTSKRTIVHVPKELNPNYTLITHNTCDMFIIPKNTTDTSGTTIPSKNGRFIHKCLREDQFHQLTHSDFSFNDSLVNEIGTAIGSTKYEVRIYIRTHNKKLGLVRDVNYCDLLYTHNDETIIKFLTGNGPASFEFWTADALEDSVYATALMDKTGTRPERDLGYYIDVLGYYNTIQLICERVVHYRVGYLAEHSFTVPIPIVFDNFNVEDMFCIVYLNGIKVDDVLVTKYANASGSSTNTEITQSVIGREWDGSLYQQLSYVRNVKTFALGLDDSIVLKQNDIVTIELFENPTVVSEVRTLEYVLTTDTVFVEGVRYYTKSTSSSGVATYTLATVVVGNPVTNNTYYTDKCRDVEFITEHYLVYKRNVGGTVKDANGVQYTGQYNYQLMDKPGDWNPNTNVLTLASTLMGSTLVLTENIGINKVYDNTNWKVEQSSWRAISTGAIFDTPDSIPILGDVSYLVFLNGKMLTENLDYTILVSKLGNNMIRREVILQNLTWLETSNKIEVYAVRATTRGYTKGYVSGAQVSASGESPFWFDHLSILAVDGCVISDYDSFFGQLFIRSVGHRNGATYLQRSLIPNTAVELIEKYRTDNDLVRLTRLRDYFLGQNDDPIERIVIPHSHSIFSIYINSIVRDFLDGVLGFEMYTDKDAFVEQFSAYEWLKKIDTAYMKQDLRYLDIYPMYHRSTTKNTLVYRKLKYLFKMLLPEDSVQYKDVING